MVNNYLTINIIKQLQIPELTKYTKVSLHLLH